MARGSSEIYAYSFDPNDCASVIEEISEDGENSFKLTKFTVSDTIRSTRFESCDLVLDHDDSFDEYSLLDNKRAKKFKNVEVQLLEDMPIELSNFRYKVIKLGVTHS